MENRDMPAMPTPVTETGSTGHGYEPSYGLTKREQFAMVAMQGFLSGRNGYSPDTKNVVNKSVEYADALLAELE